MFGIDDVGLAVASDVIKGIGKSIPSAINRLKFKRFFGRKVVKSAYVYGVSIVPNAVFYIKVSPKK